MRNRHHGPLLGATAAAIIGLSGCAGPGAAVGTLPAQTAQASLTRPAATSKAPFGKLSATRRSQQRASWLSDEARTGPVAYVADFGDNVVNVYSRTSRALVGQLTTGISAPYGVSTGPDGSVYVAEQDFENVAIYGRHSTRPKLVLVDTASPYAVAAAPDGTVYVGVGYNGVDVFPKGDSLPSYTIQDPSFAEMWAVAVDSSGNLYAGGQSAVGGGQVSEFAPGSQGPGKNLNLKGLGLPTTIQFTPSGAMLIGDYDLSTIDVYPQGKTSHSVQVHANNVAYVARLPHDNTVWAPTYGGTTVNVVSYPSGKVTQSFTVTGGAVQLTGVALSAAP